MTDFYIQFDPTGTDESVTFGSGPDGTTAMQTNTANLCHLQIGQSSFNKFPVDLVGIKNFQCNLVDAGADAVATSYVTLSPRRVQTTISIKEECDTYVAGTSIDSKFPFLHALATVNGTTMAQEQTLFLEEWAAVVPPGALIYATAEATKRKINAATTLAEIATAASVNWAAVMATLHS